MQFRDHPATTGKRDFYSVNPRKLKVDPGFNVRDLTTPDAIEKLAELKANIIANGVRVPLEVRLDDDDIYITSGHRRHAAVMAAIADGHDIKAVPVIPEAKGVNPEERTLNLIISNSGDPLAALEIAQVIARLVAFGWKHDQIATRCGWKSTQQVTGYLELLGSDYDVREMVRQGDVSATTAIAVVRKSGKNAGEVLRQAKAAAKPSKKGGNRKVTAKALHAAAGTKQLKPGQVQQLIIVIRRIAGYEDEKKSSRAAADVLQRLGL